MSADARNTALKPVLYTLRRYVNVEEILFDAGIFAIFGVIYFFGRNNRSFVDIFNPWVLVVLLFFMVLLSPWYLSYIYSQFRLNRGRNAAFRVLSYIAFAVLLFTAFFIVFAMPFFLVQYYRDNMVILMFNFMNIFTGTIALVLGWNLGQAGGEAYHKKASAGIYAYLAPVYVAGPVFLIAAFMSLVDNYIALALLVLFSVTAGYRLLSRSKQTLDMLFEKRIMQRYVFPFAISFMLAFGHEIVQSVFVAGNRTASAVLLALVVSGILPTRVMLLVCPPVKPVNVAIGIVAFSLFFREFIKM